MNSVIYRGVLTLLLAFSFFNIELFTWNGDHHYSVQLAEASMINDIPKFKKEPKDYTLEVDGAVTHHDFKQEIDETVPPGPQPLYFGQMECTAYIATGNPCADGVYPTVGYTVACNDPALWHKHIAIEGMGEFYVHDTGGMASNVLDIFVGSYDEAINFGRQVRNVYILD